MRKHVLARALASALLLHCMTEAVTLLAADGAPRPRSWSGVYPHLAYFNSQAECGTGAVVPWAGRLWVVTYAPHQPNGSADKLYEITPALQQIIRPESVGGTPANRMIHRESQQLLIGPYVIDAAANVRVISPQTMPGRLTGNARHLTTPASKVYYATMEEGLYEVDVRTLAVRELYRDANSLPDHAGLLLPGYHGKGLYTGQGRLVYANNGELSAEAQRRPDLASGCLAEWDGKDWRVVRRNQFTEVTGPGGLQGNADPVRDPLWSIGLFRYSDLDAGLYALGVRSPKGNFNSQDFFGVTAEGTAKISIALKPYDSSETAAAAEAVIKEQREKGEAFIGRVVRYIPETKEVEVLVEIGLIQDEDRIHILGQETNFYQNMRTLKAYGTKTERVLSGNTAVFPASKPCQTNDFVYIVCKRGVLPIFLLPLGVAAIEAGAIPISALYVEQYSASTIK